MKTRLSLLAAPLVLLVGCGGCPPPPGQDAGPVESSGFLRKGGVDEPYRVDDAASKLLIHVVRGDAAVCGALHSHVVEAKAVSYEFLLDADDPSKSTFRATVPAAALDPDHPDNRALFDDTKDVPLGEGDRRSIKQSVLDEVQAVDHPNLVFSIEGLPAATGEGTATVKVLVAGLESEVEMQYTSTKTEEDGKDVFVVQGRGVLDGTRHGMPRAELSKLCVKPEMDLVFDLRIAPGAGEAPEDAGQVQEFEPTFYGDEDDCSDTIGFNDVRDQLMVRCAGCHMDPPRNGATIPLDDWRDYWTDSARHPGGPIWETARDLVFPPAGHDETLVMPPVDPNGGFIATDLTPDERAELQAWFDDGAKRARCQDDPAPTTFAATPPATGCGPTGYDQVVEFLTTYCFYCHTQDQTISPAAPVFDAYALGVVEADHPFYKPLTIWEASLARIDDDSMPPGGKANNGIDVSDPATQQALDTMRAWIAGGFPEATCADAGVPDGGP